MENTESRLQNAPYFRCEKGNSSVPVCQKCETCVLAWKIFSTEEWFRRVGKMSQRRFLVSILQQLDSLYLLHYFQNILQTTQGKDFVYHRSRVNLSKKEGKIVKSPLNQMLDKTVEQKMREILYWFGNSSYRTKANYTLLLLQMCDPELLLTAVDVIRVLFLRGRNDASGNDPDSKDVFFVPEKGHTPPCETSQVCWAARPGHTSFPLSKTTGKASLHENVWWGAATTEGQWKSSLRYISEMNRLSSEKASVSEAGSAPAADVLVDLEAVRELSSGVSRYRDFIRHLPVHLAKYILSTRGLLGDFSGPRPPPSQRSWEVPRSTSCFPGMLDKNSLNRCVFVNQHWAVLAQQVKTDLSMHSFIQHQITFLQGSYTRGIDPNYASKVTIPVPKMADDGKHLCVKNQKRKLRTKVLWSESRSPGTPELPTRASEDSRDLCSLGRWDRNRVIHYSGGDLLAVSSNRKIQLLDIIQIKQIPIKFRGHTGSVRTLFLCEEENFLLSGSYDLSIRYWDLDSGACVRIFSGHQGTITCMDVCKNKLASGAKDCQVKEWDIETGKCLKTFKHKDPILATRISDTYIVSSCEKGLVKVWHVVTAQLVKTLSAHEGAVKCLCFDQWHLLSGSADGLVMAWSMVGKYERCLMAFRHPKEVLHVALLFLRVISACADGKIRIYNFLNGNCLKVMKASGRGYPVLSFFIQGNRMVINTESNVLMFQFENIKWQYSLERAKQKKKDKEEDREANGLAEVLSKSSTQIYSPRESISSKQTAQESLFSKSHRSRVLLRASRLPTGVLTEAPLSQGKPKSPRRDGRKRLSSREANGTGTEQENLEAKPLAGDKKNDDVEKIPEQGQLGTLGDLINCSKKKSWCIRMSPDQFLLTVNALQRAHNSGEFAYPRRPQTQVIDAWGPSISYPRKVLSLKGRSVQHAVDRLRLSNPPIDVKQTSIPLEIQKLQPNLKNSVHSPRVQSTIPQPVLICPRFSGSLRGEDPATSSADGAARSFSPLTSTQVIKRNHILAPPMGTTAQAAKKDRSRFYTALDPFRVNTEFMLLTVKEEKEYEEAKMKEFQAIKPAGGVDPEKASRAAWIRKIKGLPIDNFMKQGKTAAPELGQNVFI
ncbi:F-box/WD repeat-containing protein 10 isoform X2 [Physeter macrocephalus]|uniref:F-box/WD repeat-containing protein 10 isoform X2 n=1 Tax=Physeter macrocephalus TaxID=9755 RepID=A0A455CB47_PHYMC|nr:F-box/WD repeat-containing protein 10 isoform X2 [Physeter catodon]|eukprot:XP_028355801.1 F-box/WD repeat-containing protein 10 isoform X2 [Physeter catodon]